ncbi:50S ribosomal protein L25 [Halobacteriovorax vibrionivorans]|uniref:Large ribosomal subunit protein bL25 n=2 Tax=Halobacteriovoraceae TaxID=1652132 RepID=A0ABY0IFX3_9BACT|nr:50S ribosomal protein L25 [Halobacteriovorax vibrionivorans]TGD49170.1 50S ribosomal protein L25 [Halobacteriovorax sp. Y22]
MHLIYKSICVRLLLTNRNRSTKKRMVMSKMTNKLTQLKIEDRDLHTKTHELRDMGLIPGTMYGPNVENTPVRASELDLKKAISKTGEVYEVKSKKRTIFVKFEEIQRDPVSKELVHFSLVELPKGETNEVEVPIVAMGEPAGRKKGGVLVLMHDNITLSGTPKDMPAKVEIDVSGLDIAENLTVADMKLPKKVEAMMDMEEVIAICRPPAKEESTEEESSDEMMLES